MDINEIKEIIQKFRYIDIDSKNIILNKIEEFETNYIEWENETKKNDFILIFQNIINQIDEKFEEAFKLSIEYQDDLKIDWKKFITELLIKIEKIHENDNEDILDKLQNL